MDKTIKDFPKQFEYEPVIENAGAFAQKKYMITAGMGGSHLSADILQMAYPDANIIAHENYGLPMMSESILNDSMLIANSYSGNTEETIDAFEKAIEKKIPVAVIATGGKLLERAKKEGIAYIQMPATGIQPRMALGFHIRALLKLVGKEEAFQETATLLKTLDVTDAEKKGKTLAEKLQGKIPVIYSSAENRAIAYNWKIKFNETGKIPAFYNVFPELNHNEMASFDIQESTKKMGEMFHFIFLTDSSDHPRIQRRMEVCKKLYEDRELPVGVQHLEGKNIWEKIFNSLLIADWASFYTATHYGLESEQVSMVEEFKKMI